MYVREKKVRRGDKTYSYWQLVQSAWVEGKSRQSVVKHLGALPDRLSADVVARLEGHICGVMPCGQAGVEEMAVVKGDDGEPGVVLLCGEHHAEMSAGETLTAVALER